MENNKIKLSQVLKITKLNQLDNLMQEFPDLNESGSPRELTTETKSNHWQYVGNNRQNASTIDMLSVGEKGLIERVTNAIDAVIEKSALEYNGSKKELDDIIKFSFPLYYKNMSDIERGEDKKLNPLELKGKVILAVNDGSKSSRPTFDIIDEGKGINGEKFPTTILSIQGGNKIEMDKRYLIGSFGQGGSTSLAFANATMIISKIDQNYYFTVVKKMELEDLKSHVYVYLVNENERIMTLEEDKFDLDEFKYLESFIECDSGTLVRMIETDVSSKCRKNDATKPYSLIDYVNTELFHVKIPVKIVENRKQFTTNSGHQDRNAYGSKLKLMNSKNKIEKYSGEFEYEYGNDVIQVEYYVILPDDENKWGSDSECKKKFTEYNWHEKSIIYTVNGQYINGVKSTKISNKGLNFLQYRLLVNVNLDKLGKKKYSFFTTDRNSMKLTTEAKNFEDGLIEKLSKEKSLLDINQIISEKSIAQGIDDEVKKKISDAVKNEYLDFLNENEVEKKPNGRKIGGIADEKEYLDEIVELKINNTKEQYYLNESPSIVLNTGAHKYVNKEAGIDMFINGKSKNVIPTIMKGKMNYTIENLAPGDYTILFAMYKPNEIESNEYQFTVVNEIIKGEKKAKRGDIDLTVNIVNDKEYICRVTTKEDAIEVNVCFDHPNVEQILHNYTSEQVEKLKLKMLPSIAIFGLVLNKVNEDVLNQEQENRLFEANIRSCLSVDMSSK